MNATSLRHALRRLGKGFGIRDDLDAKARLHQQRRTGREVVAKAVGSTIAVMIPVIILVWVACAALCGWIAHQKNRNIGLWVIIGLLTALIGVIITALLPDKRREKENEEKAIQEQRRSEIEEEWKILTRYDTDVRTQVERLEPYGGAAVAELKRVYKRIKDKTQVKDIADQIIADIENGKFETPALEVLDSESRKLDSKGFTADGNCQVFKTYQVRRRDDGEWWIETLDGELHPSFKRGYPNLGKAKRAAVEKLGQQRALPHGG